MHKWLRRLVPPTLRLLILPALIATVILVTRHYKDYDTGPKGYDARCIQENQSSPAAGYLVCSIETSKNAQTGKPQLQWWDKLSSWPEGITAWAILLTLYAIGWQAWETRKAAEATKASADATSVQVEISRKAFISQFRPKLPLRGMWLREKNGALTVEVWVTNIGGTTARIIGSDIKVMWEIPRELKEDLVATKVFDAISLQAGREHSAKVDITRIYIPYKAASRAVEEMGRDQEAWISCFGYLAYEDDNGAYRSTGFLRKYDIKKKRFIPSDDPNDEYTD
jgi:hypothetical protein